MNTILQNLILVALIVGLQTSCSESIKPNSIKLSDKQDVELFTNSSKIIKNDRRSLNLYENIVYCLVLERIFYGDEFGEIPGNKGLAYRKTTIPVENIDALKSNLSVPSELLSNLQTINATPKMLADKYGIHLSHWFLDDDDSLPRLLEKNQQKNSRIGAVIEFSRIAFNEKRDESLVFVRFYDSEKKIQERYCLIFLNVSEQSVYKKDLKWINLQSNPKP